MANTPESDEKANSQPKPTELPSPKRGAIPTPKAELEKAKPYIPETDPAGDQKATDADPQKNR